MRSPRPGSTRFLLFLVLAILLVLTLPACAQNFTQPQVVPTGSWPTAIYTADMNGDGIPDLVYSEPTLNPTTSLTHVLLNDGKGNFTAAGSISTIGSSVAVADFIGGGHPQIAFAFPSGIQPPNSALQCGLSYAIQVDLVLINAAGAPSGSVISSFCASGTNQPIVGNLTAGKMHDGKPADLLMTDSANNVLYVVDLNGNGITSGFVSLSATLPLLGGPGPISIADLNNDGHLDFVILGLTTFVPYTFYGDGQGNFPTGANLAGYLPPIHSLLLHDVNNDGIPDLIAETASGHIDVYSGAGGSQTTSIGGTGSLNGLTGNGGHLIAYANRKLDGLPYALTATPAGISSLLGNGTAYLGLNGIYNAGPVGGAGHPSYAVADFNSDGNLDLAVDSPEGIAILYGNPDGSLQTSRAFAAGQPAMSGALGAFTASGNTDAVVSTGASQAQLLLGDGTGLFAAISQNGLPVPTTSSNGIAGLWSVVAAHDFNGDGKLDIALTADGPNAALPPAASQLPNGSLIPSPNGIAIQLGNGDGTFLAPVNPMVLQQFSFPSSTSCSPPFKQYPGILYGVSAFADLNGDGLMDIANRDTSGYRILRGNNGSPTSSNTMYPTLFYAGADGTGTTVDCNPHAHDLVIAGDLNNDGIPDLIYQGFQANSGSLLVDLTSSAGSPIHAGDLSVAGSLTSPGQLTAPALNATFNGPAIPVSSAGLGFPAFPGSAVIADIDLDGNQDLLVVYANLAANLQAPNASAPNYIYIWFGDGTGHFPVSARHPVNPVRLTPSRNFYQAVVANVDADGIPDLILSDGYILSVQLGLGGGAFGAETHYLAGQGINSISVADINHDNKPDFIVANGGAVLTNPVANLETLATNPDVNTGGITVLLNHELQTVTPALSAAPEPSSYGSGFTITAVLRYSGTTVPTGTVNFSFDGVVFATGINVISGVASISFPAGNTFAVGAHTLGATYSGDTSYGSSTFAGTHTVAPALAPASATLSASPEPSTYSNPFTLNVNFAAATPAPTGTVSFSIDGNAIGSANIAGSAAVVFVPATIYGTLAVGPHSITGIYSGDSDYAPSTLASSHNVAKLPSSISLLLCVDPPGSNFPCANPISATPLISPVTMFYGQSIDGVAIESGTDLTGTITFYNGAAIFCTLNANLSQGTTMCPVQSGFFPAGNTQVDVVYSGDSNNLASTSNSVQVIVSPDPTIATLSSSLNPSTFGQSVTFIATVQGNYAAGAGTVLFLDATTIIGTATLDATGFASFTTSTLAVGTHPISVAFPGSVNFNSSTSSTVNQKVNPAVVQAAVTLTSAPNPSYFGQLVTFTASFASVTAGTFTFFDGSTSLGSVTGVGSAVFTISSLAVGTHPVTAVFQAANSALAGTSAVLNQVVTADATTFTLNVTPVPVAVEIGHTAILLATVTETGGFSAPVQLTCSGLPGEATCSFVQSLIPAGGGSTSLYLYVQAPHPCNTSAPYAAALTPAQKTAATLLACLILLPFTRRRGKLFPRAVLFSLVALAGLATLSGCGNCTDLGVRPGNYTFTVTATAQGVSATQSQTITLTVRTTP